MKIRSKLTIALFLLTTALVSLFSVTIFYQVSERTLAHAKADLVQHLQHDFEHLHEIEPREAASHLKGTYHRIEQGKLVLSDNLPADLKGPNGQLRIGAGVSRDYVVAIQQKEKGGEIFDLTGAADLRQTRHYLQLLGGLLVLGVLLVAGLMIPASWWLAGWCLSPFRQLANQTDALDATGLSFRFPNGEEWRQPDDEYNRLVGAFNRLLTRLDRAFGELNLFAAKASHELKTPLASMLAQTEKALRRKDLGEETRETLLKILTQASRLSRVTEQLLVLADLDSKRSRPPSVSSDAATVIQQLVDSFVPKAAAMGKIIRFALPPKLRVEAESDVLAISVGNLIENALKFGRNQVLLTLSQNQNSAEIIVEDDGPGLINMQAVEIIKPFEKERQLSDGSKNPGSGLGLAIVQTAVESSHGTLSFNQSGLGGLLARITIPLTS